MTAGRPRGGGGRRRGWRPRLLGHRGRGHRYGRPPSRRRARALLGHRGRLALAGVARIGRTERGELRRGVAPGRLPRRDLRGEQRAQVGGQLGGAVGHAVGAPELVDRLAEGQGGRVAIGRRRRQGPHHDLLEGRGIVVDHCAGASRRTLDHRAQELVVVAAAKQLARGRQLEQHDPGAEHVAPPIERQAPALFGSHVAELALDGPRPRPAQAVLGLGDPEVDHLHGAVEGREHVVGRHVAVDQAEGPAGLVGQLVGVVEASADRARDEQRERQRQASASGGHPTQHGDQIAAVQELHHHEHAVWPAIDVEDLDDVGVLERGREPGLVEEHPHHRLLAGEVAVQALDHHPLGEAAQAGGPGQEHLGHPAARHRPEELVAPELRRRGGHRAIGRQEVGVVRDDRVHPITLPRGGRPPRRRSRRGQSRTRTPWRRASATIQLRSMPASRAAALTLPWLRVSKASR